MSSMPSKKTILVIVLSAGFIQAASVAARAQNATTGEISFNNKDGSAIEVLGPYAGTSNTQGNNLTLTQEAVASGGTVASNSSESPLYTFSANAKTTIDVYYYVTPASGPSNGNYGCEFEVIYSYQGSPNGVTQDYYPNTYATAIYPSGATTIPTCYAEASGPQLAYNSPNPASFDEFFQISGLP